MRYSKSSSNDDNSGRRVASIEAFLLVAVMVDPKHYQIAAGADVIVV